jgi:hypothetical protein
MKAETGHTPGPWGSQGAWVFPRDQTSNFSICMAEYVGCGFKEAIANARLIAAAPELLAALKEMREFIRIRFPDDSLASGNWPTVKPLVEKWDAAIAKAEGK